MIPISAMTSVYRDRTTGVIDQCQAIRRLKKVGFDIADMTLHSMKKPSDSPLCRPGWEKELERILATKEEVGVTFYQTHPDFRKGSIRAYEDPEAEAFFWTMVRRGLYITAQIGAKWAVLHPVNDVSTMDVDFQIRLNHRVYDELVDYAAKLGIGIAFENMVETGKDGKPHRFSSYPEELIALCDSYHCDQVKLCWDFGHGNTAIPDRQDQALRDMGSRLVCLHVDDNFGGWDQHLLPFRGNVPWEKLMPVLKEIHFPGNINLEVPFSSFMPKELTDEAVHFTYSISQKLARMAEGTV